METAEMGKVLVTAKVENLEDLFRAKRQLIATEDVRSVEVTELPDDCPMLIGQVPLELLDSVVDPIHQRLIGNPEHGGEHVIELY